jgi:hypothetical protein
MIELVLHNSFSWVFRSYMFKFDISLWASLLNANNFACFFVASFKSTNMKWSDIKTNSYIWDSFAITSKIGERKFVNWQWLCTYIEFVRIATFNVDCE